MADPDLDLWGEGEGFVLLALLAFLSSVMRSATELAGASKSRDYRDVIVFEKLRFQSIFPPY